MRWLLFFYLSVSCLGCIQSDRGRALQFLEKGNDEFQRKNYEEAVNFYHEALKIDSCYLPAWNNLGLLAFKRTDYGAAVLNYSNAIQCDPNYFDAILNRAHAFYEAGDEAQALSDVKRLKQLKPDTAVVYFLEGLVETRRQNFRGAVAAFRHSFVLDTINSEVLINIGTVLYFERKYDSALQVLHNAMRIAPDNPNAFNAMALVLSGKEKYNDALAWIDRALDKDSANAWFINNRGYIYLQLNRMEDGLADINRSLVLDEENGWAYRNKGFFYMKTGDLLSAVRLFKRAAETNQFVEDLYLWLGDAYQQMGDQKNACESWQKEKFDSEAAKRLVKCHQHE